MLLLLLCGACASASAETGRPGLVERLRVGSLVASVAFGLVPLAHFCLVAPSDEVAIFFPPVMQMFVFYGLGFVFYGSAMPESLQPGLWDLRGGSHFLWHMCVLAAIASYDNGAQTMLLYHEQVACQSWPM